MTNSDHGSVEESSVGSRTDSIVPSFQEDFLGHVISLPNNANQRDDTSQGRSRASAASPSIVLEQSSPLSTPRAQTYNENGLQANSNTSYNMDNSDEASSVGALPDIDDILSDTGVNFDNIENITLELPNEFMTRNNGKGSNEKSDNSTSSHSTKSQDLKRHETVPNSGRPHLNTQSLGTDLSVDTASDMSVGRIRTKANGISNSISDSTKPRIKDPSRNRSSSHQSDAKIARRSRSPKMQANPVRFSEENIELNLYPPNPKRLSNSPNWDEGKTMYHSGRNTSSNAFYSSPGLLSIGSTFLFNNKTLLTQTSQRLENSKCLEHIHIIPDNILLHIFSFMGIGYVEDHAYNLVCKRWYMTLSLDILWRDRYFAYFTSKTVQQNPPLLTHVKEFDLPQKNKFRYHLITLRKKKYFLKQRILLQNRHEKSRKYFLFNSFVLNPLVAIICFMVSTITFGLQEDEVIAKNDRNTLLFVFLPFFASFLFSVVGNISLGLRETMFCKHGFFDASHFIHFLAIIFGQYTFYFCAFLYGLKWFWFKSALWTAFTIPCICIYVIFVGLCYGYVIHKYIRRRILFYELKNDYKKLKPGTADYFDFAYRLRSHKRREFYSKSKYITQPVDGDFIEFSEDDGDTEDLTEEDYEDSFDDSTAFDDETESASKNTKTDEMVSAPKNKERKKESIPKVTLYEEFEKQELSQRITDISTTTILLYIFIILLMIGLEMLLIPLKIDAIITSSWISIFIPIWIIILLLICGCPAWVTWEIATKTILDKKTISTSVDPIVGEDIKRKNKNDTERQCAFFAFASVPMCVFIPLMVAVIVLVSTLDGANIPFSVSCALFAFWEFVIGGIYLMVVIPYTLTHNAYDV